MPALGKESTLMSAGPFVTAQYEAPGGLLVACKVQPETLSAVIDGEANESVSGPVVGLGTFPLNVGSRRKTPFSARSVTLKFINTVPSGYSAQSRPRIPIMSQTFFNSIAKGSTGSYLGQAVEVVGTSSHENN